MWLNRHNSLVNKRKLIPYLRKSLCSFQQSPTGNLPFEKQINGSLLLNTTKILTFSSSYILKVGQVTNHKKASLSKQSIKFKSFSLRIPRDRS